MHVKYIDYRDATADDDGGEVTTRGMQSHVGLQAHRVVAFTFIEWWLLSYRWFTNVYMMVMVVVFVVVLSSSAAAVTGAENVAC
jgi:hypothetical protein